MNTTKLIALFLLPALLAGCSTMDQLAGVGEAPKLSAIEDPTAQAGYKPAVSSSDGELVNVDGYAIQPGITIPENATSVSISADGTVEAFLDNSTTPTQLGQLQLARFVNKAGLASAGNNLFLETASSGAAQIGTPNSEGVGDLLQGYLESSNVNSVTEIADLIAAQRAYEMNARVISGADEMMQATSQLR